MSDRSETTNDSAGFCPDCFEGFGAYHEPSCPRGLTARETSAIRELKRLVAKGYSIGRKRIVSMQRLEEKGLVKRVTYNGMIADWRLTPKGDAWND